MLLILMLDLLPAMQQLDVDPNTGFAPIQWGGWEETWSSRSVETMLLEVIQEQEVSKEEPEE